MASSYSVKFRNHITDEPILMFTCHDEDLTIRVGTSILMMLPDFRNIDTTVYWTFNDKVVSESGELDWDSFVRRYADAQARRRT